MPATLTLNTTDYALSDNTNFATQYSASLLTGSDVVTVVGSVANYGLDTANGKDTLTISATLTGNGSANSTFATGANTDLITIGGTVSNYIIDGGSGDDTLIIAANASGTTFSGNTNNDSITLNAGVTLTGGTIQGGTTASSLDADTIVLSGAGIGTRIASFSKASDTLLVGATPGATPVVVSGLTNLANGTYNATQLNSAAGFSSVGNGSDLVAWLTNGNNTITLI
jgi:hypothetical protein